MENILTDKKIFSVTELTRNIKNRLENAPELNSVWIKGEISNLTFHSSGHIYFSLKDEGALIDAVFFKYSNKNLSFKLEEGMSVLVFASVTVFEKRGKYQINVQSLRLEGIGELQKKIEQLKIKLAAEGMFNQERKRKLPFLPKRLGIATSPTGAAVRDIIKVALRRFPNLEIIIAPAKVQGEKAAESIAKAINELNKPGWDIDLIIAGRGGGSFEDLMPFNEEIVVRAFYNSRVPIISAVGHQIDHPLSDDAADLSAPTPSAAAEIAVPIKTDLDSEIEYLMNRTSGALYSMIREYKNSLVNIENLKIMKSPLEIISGKLLFLSDLETRLIYEMNGTVARNRNLYNAIPDIKLLMKGAVSNFSHRYGMALQALEKLSPVSILKRGYSISRDSDGRTLKSVNDARIGSNISVQLKDGRIGCVVNSKEKEVEIG
jgi:exodeoxyribonuclease VII large subunit